MPPSLKSRFETKFHVGRIFKISNFGVTENNTAYIRKVKHEWTISIAMSTIVVEIIDQPDFPWNSFSFIPYADFLPNPNNNNRPTNVSPDFAFGEYKSMHFSFIDALFLTQPLNLHLSCIISRCDWFGLYTFETNGICHKRWCKET